jgi:major vault protein
MKAVFGSQNSYTIPSNNLCILSVDVRKQNPTDKDIQNMLNKHTSIAIDVKAKASEAQYRHKRAIAEQESKGQLEKQRIEDLLRAQDSTLQLTKTQTESRRLLIESQKLNEVKAAMGSKLMVAQSKLDRAKKVAETINIESAAEIDQVTQEKQSIFDLQRDSDTVEVKRAEGLARIETEKFQELIRAIGRETIVALARAGPAQQAKLLGALGLKGYLVTDGKNPINLFNTANSMVAGQLPNASQ